MGSESKRQEQLKELFSQLREYVYYPNTFWPLALLKKKEKQDTATLYYYHCDINGAPTRLTDSQGRIVWSEQTGVWGEKGTIYASEINNPLRFQGQYYDQETGLHYNRFRYYEPYSNSYICKDPIGLAGGANTYKYVLNSIHWVDPFGLTPCKIKARAQNLKLRNDGKNSVTIPTSDGAMRVDLDGKPHFDKVTKAYVETPHVVFYRDNIIPSGPKAGEIGSRTQVGDVIPATMDHIDIVDNYLTSLGK